jgi:hypothetical protein
VHHLTNFRLPELHLPHLRLPSVRIGWPKVDLDDPSRLTEPLQFFFYLLMFVALLAILTGASGTGVLMLVVGSLLHVVRSSLEETVAQRQARRERAERKRQVRLRSHRAARKPDEEIRASATPRLQARRAAAKAQPPASSARKQRVI